VDSINQNPEHKRDDTLQFESRFESGNLRRAVQVGSFEYDLILKYDYGTTNYTQWFYFRVKNTRKDATYKFNIINLVKPESSYN
jgi:cytosolic carboxypeptidase protein 2/3